jgi:hypothetical protein
VRSQYAVLWHALEFAALHRIIVQVPRPSLLKQETPLCEIVDLDVSDSASGSCASVVGVVAKVRDYSIWRVEEAFHIEEETI